LTVVAVKRRQFTVGGIAGLEKSRKNAPCRRQQQMKLRKSFFF
jgi:hypothetical protein